MRIHISTALVLMTLSTAAAPCQSLPPEVLLIARAKRQLKETLDHLPDFTCLQTTRRFQGTAAQQKALDVVRLEVLYTAGREYFASPGGHSFQGSHPSEFASSGLSENGTFALYLKSIFLDGNAVITFVGEENVLGIRTTHYTFRLPSMWSGFQVTQENVTATLGLKGSVWIDSQTANIVRLEMSADDIPLRLPIKELTTTVNYALTTVGSQVILAPQSGDTTVVGLRGEAQKNEFDFTHCRSYQAESSISFEPETSPQQKTTVTTPKPSVAGPLPSGLTIALRLAGPVTYGSAVGDLIKAEVESDVSRAGKILVTKGTRVTGRIRQLELHGSGEAGYAIGALEFTDIELGGGWMRFYAELTGVEQSEGLEWQTAEKSKGMQTGNIQIERPGMDSALRPLFSGLPRLPGVGSFATRNQRFRIPAGFRMVWQTLAF